MQQTTNERAKACWPPVCRYLMCCLITRIPRLSATGRATLLEYCLRMRVCVRVYLALDMLGALSVCPSCMCMCLWLLCFISIPDSSS